MPEETPQLSVSEQVRQPADQIQSPSFLDKLKIHKRKILGGILGVLVLIGAVFGAYKLGQRQIQPSQPTPTPEAVATPTPDLTANWETYTNEEFSFLIKYPVNWFVFDCSATFYEEYPLHVHFSDDERENCNTPAKAMMLRVALNFLKDFDQNNPFGYSLFQSFENPQKEEINIGGKDAILISGTREILGDEGEKLPSRPEVKEKVAIIPYRDNLSFAIRYTQVYRLEPGVSTSGFYVKQDANNTFNLMLSTFKFLEEDNILPSPTPTIKIIYYEYIKDWPLYSALGMGFSFQYPSSYSSPKKNTADPGAEGEPFCEFLSTRKPEGAQNVESIRVLVVPYEGGSRRALLMKRLALFEKDVLSVQEIEFAPVKGLLIEFKPQYPIWEKYFTSILIQGTTALIIGNLQIDLNEDEWNNLLKSFQIKDFHLDLSKCESDWD